MIEILRSFLGGFLMGSADLVPGVSGGTIALVIGIYERLVGSIRQGSSALGSLITGKTSAFLRHLKAVEWAFLIPLLAGLLLAVVSLAGVISHQLETRPTVMAGFFFGLVVASVIVAWRLVRSPAITHLVIALAVGAGLFGLLGLGEEATVADPTLPIFFVAGALAICAMILPGISGSLILLLIGMYQAVLDAVNDRDVLTISVFVVGAIVGLALFSQILHWSLRRYHDLVLAGLIGLMAGSLRVVWPWPAGVESAALGAPEGDLAVVSLAAAAGVVAVLVISRLARSREDVSEPQPVG